MGTSADRPLEVSHVKHRAGTWDV